MDIRRYSIMVVAAAGLSLPATGFAVAQDAMPAPTEPQTEQPQAQQTPAGEPMTEQPAAQAQDYSDETLRSFAVAFLEVDAINKAYTPKLQQAATPEEQQQIQEEASQEMVNAVEGSDGISVQEYTSIMQAAQADPELAQKLTDYIGEASGGAPSQPAAPAQ
jgi:hypothetical protein